ncbi:flagellar hook-associated protein FlgK [Paenibacillus koleovorans]|uniref:flagellar hook-associated protein FlgK n=1 Tax=Paenibacillus koleovorans TaxID=121608 RepID=UPI000FDA2813|nr:flagellar hook-associated protein FlgK [Paenibacillus koleovorans]
MRSTFTGIEIAKRSLFTHQAALTTTGHNIANSNTKGYTRQVVNFSASRPLEAIGLMRSTIPGQNGQGVEFTSIERIREKFLDDQFLNENKSLGQWTIRSDTLEKLEKIVNEPSDTGIRQTIEGFWNAWQELTKYPDSRTNRVLVKERTIALTDSINHTAVQLKELRNDLTSNIEVRARQIDNILGNVAKLNNEIFRVEGLGNDANDLRDQRDLLVDELSGYINVSVTETEQGYTLNMGSTTLVDGNEKSVDVDRAFLESAFGGEMNSGEVYGMIFSRDQLVTSYMEDLNVMVRAMVQGEVEITLPAGTMIPDGVTLTDKDGTEYTGTLAADTNVIVNGLNGLHQLGYTLNDTPGQPYFLMTAGAEAETLKMNPDIVENVFLIAASNRTFVDENGETKVVKGSNEIALLIAGLKNKKFEYQEGQTGSIDDFFRSIIGELGVQGQEAHRQLMNQTALVEHVESRRQSVSGVSLDEEMSNMIKYQHAYNAAARAMTSCDEILDKVINGMGVVGR